MELGQKGTVVPWQTRVAPQHQPHVHKRLQLWNDGRMLWLAQRFAIINDLGLRHVVLQLELVNGKAIGGSIKVAAQ